LGCVVGTPDSPRRCRAGSPWRAGVGTELPPVCDLEQRRLTWAGAAYTSPLTQLGPCKGGGYPSTPEFVFGRILFLAPSNPMEQGHRAQTPFIDPASKVASVPGASLPTLWASGRCGFSEPALCLALCLVRLYYHGPAVDYPPRAGSRQMN
jgi:hypothetical protein